MMFFIKILCLMLPLSFFASQSAFEQMQEQAIKEKKLFLISIEKEQCPYCLKMQQDVFTHPRFKEFIHDKFLHLAILNTDIALPKSLKAKYFPTTFIVKPDDLTIIDEFAGYMNLENSLELLDEVYLQSKAKP